MEKEKLQDANIKTMAKYLREGAKMLDLACPICNNPVFQLKTGEKACVVCERQVIIKNDDAKSQQDEIDDSKNTIKSSSNEIVENGNNLARTTPHENHSQIFANLKQACILKLTAMTRKLNDLENINEISNLCGTIYKILEILDKLRF